MNKEFLKYKDRFSLRLFSATSVESILRWDAGEKENQRALSTESLKCEYKMNKKQRMKEKIDVMERSAARNLNEKGNSFSNV